MKLNLINASPVPEDVRFRFHMRALNAKAGSTRMFKHGRAALGALRRTEPRFRRARDLTDIRALFLVALQLRRLGL